MIAFVTIKSSLIPLVQGLHSQTQLNYGVKHTHTHTHTCTHTYTHFLTDFDKNPVSPSARGFHINATLYLTLVARRRVHFWVFLAVFLVSQLPLKRGILVHKNLLDSYQRCSHSVEPRTLTCPFTQSNLSAWSYPNLQALGQAFSLLYVISYELFWN